MDEILHNAQSELKRIDHLIHVSLKYTRTVDVLVSVLKRFISFIDFTMDALMLKAKDENEIDELPQFPAHRVNTIKKLYPEDKVINNNLDDYMLFRRLVRAPNSKRNEYRRYVTMTVDDNGTIVEIDIDKVVEYDNQLKDYFNHIKKLVLKNEEE